MSLNQCRCFKFLVSFLLFAQTSAFKLPRSECGGSRSTHIGVEVNSELETQFTCEVYPKVNFLPLMLAASILISNVPYAEANSLDKGESMSIRRVMEQPPDSLNKVLAPTGAQSVSKNVVLPSGLTYYDYKIGEGAEVEEGKSIQFLWVLRRSNGYFVDGSTNYNNEPFIYRVGNTKRVIKGIDEGIRGMKVGGIRRMIIPSELAFVEGVGDDKPGPMPAEFGPRRQISTRQGKESWYFEIQLLKVR